MSCDLAIVGGGPAGLEAARVVAGRGLSVVVIDREPVLGGIPRHCHHTGFGLEDLRRMLSGPAYAERRVELARRAGAALLSETTVLAVEGRTVSLTSPRGPSLLEARALLLATGCRERPRAARLVPGSRPLGVFTTGSLQQLVYLRGARAGRLAVVVGAEHVSFSAVHTLASTGTKVAAMITGYPAHQSYEPFRWLTAGWNEVPILVEHEVTRIDGARRVEAVEVTHRRTGERRVIECDTVVFTGDWIPDHELARQAGLALDGGTRGPAVDQRLRTSAPGIFAAGNLLHGAETADVSALDGRHAAQTILDYFERDLWPARIPITVEVPLLWIQPNAVVPGGGAPPRGRLLLRASQFRGETDVHVMQGRRLLHSQRFRRLVPNRQMALPSDWVQRVIAGEGPVRVVCSGG